MLTYKKEVHEFKFIYEKENFEVLYTKEYDNFGNEIDNSFVVQGNINKVKEVEELLYKHYLEIAELLAADIELEEINNEDLYNYEIELETCEGCGEKVPLDDMSDVMEMYICNKCEHGEEQ